MTALPVRRREFFSAVVVLGLTVGFLIWANTYPPPPGTVPVLVAWATIVLCLIDIASQFETTAGRWVRRLVTAEKIVEWKMEGDEEASTTRVLASIGWIMAYLGGLFLVGFLITTPVYVLLYMVIHGGRSLRDSALTAAATTLTIYVVFVLLFKYPLYKGLLFGA